MFCFQRLGTNRFVTGPVHALAGGRAVLDVLAPHAALETVHRPAAIARPVSPLHGRQTQCGVNLFILDL